jgi:hypothetical protein
LAKINAKRTCLPWGDRLQFSYYLPFPGGNGGVVTGWVRGGFRNRLFRSKIQKEKE